MTTLTELLRAVPPPALVPLAITDAGRDAEVTDVVIHERTEQVDVETGSVLLAVGVSRAELEALLGEAADRGVAAVVVRGDPGSLGPARARCRRLGLPLLAVGPEIGWTQLAVLLRNAVSTSGGHLGDGDWASGHDDLTAVANSLAATVRGSVLIFNPQQEVLAASRLRPEDDLMRVRAVADQRGPAAYREALREMGVYRRLWASDDVVEIPPVPGLQASRRMAVAVRAGEEILGSIWVAEGAEPLAEDGADVLRGAAAAAGGHLVWLQARALTHRRFAESLVMQVVAGDVDPVDASTWLGVQPDQPCRVVLLWLPEAAERRRLAGLVSMHLSAFRMTALTVAAHGLVEVLLCDLPEEGLPTATVRDVVLRVARALGSRVVAAVGSDEESLSGASASHHEAETVLRVLRRHGADSCDPEATTTADLTEVRTEVQLEELWRRVGEEPQLRAGFAERLVAWDEEHGTGYAASVLALLDAFGSVSEAAAVLHLHPNTLRYRIRRACELSGLDLGDPGHRLMTHLQLSARGLSDRTHEPGRSWPTG